MDCVIKPTLIVHHFLRAERDQRLKIRYGGVNAKDHEQHQRAGEGSSECNIKLATTLPRMRSNYEKYSKQAQLYQLRTPTIWDLA